MVSFTGIVALCCRNGGSQTPDRWLNESRNTHQKKVRFYLNLDLLILDDFLLHTITDEREIKILFELLEKRNEQQKSTIVCSQRNPENWKAMILNDEVSANSIMKRATKHYTIKINTR